MKIFRNFKPVTKEEFYNEISSKKLDIHPCNIKFSKNPATCTSEWLFHNEVGRPMWGYSIDYLNEYINGETRKEYFICI